ncbi:MAG: WYL domain-containing protein [Lachnospiraceae bacterium]|nr:WYL domain-containing protein [Lachnospiraceae bacterium]MCI6533386.1 WYL domain-containing protein [Lachnospiraceae bacterium]MDY2612633.1 WYL domain-containing protein [Lachnospiraceae bacterium]
MYTKQPKKMLIMNILDILKKYTDENHRLSQKEIMDILEQEYDMKAERKAIKRNLMNLIDSGYDIEYSESIRMNKNGEEETFYTDWYLERNFSDAELRLLIDGLLFSKHIPYSQCKELIGKLEGLSNRYFKSRVEHILTLPDNVPENTQLFYTIEVLDKAITKGQQVLLHYNEYGTDKQMHPRRRSDGAVREYVINPYQLVAVNGKYYLICNYDKYDDVSNYRLDRITDIKMLDTPVKPMKLVKGLENGLNLPKHMAEHIYMFTGESVPVVFKAKRYLLTELFDWFGKDMQFLEETENEVTVRVNVNLEAMRKWALQYAVHVKVVSPKKLVDMVKEDIKNAMEQYEEEK